MQNRVSALRAGLTAIALGGATGALHRTSMEAYGATIAAVVWPWAGALAAQTVAQFLPQPSVGLPLPRWVWGAVAIGAIGVGVGERLPAGLAAAAGASGLPPVALEGAWLVACAVLLVGPAWLVRVAEPSRPPGAGADGSAPARLPTDSEDTATSRPPDRVVRSGARIPGLLLAAGVLLGLLCPPIVAAGLLVLSLVASHWATPLAFRPTSRPSSPADLEARIVQGAAVGVGTWLAATILIILRPALDPSAVLPASAAVGAAAGVALGRHRAQVHPWVGWLAVAALGCLLSLTLPHSVGLQRLFLSTALPLLDHADSPLSPSLLSVPVGLLGGLAAGAFVAALPSGAARPPERPLAAAAGLVAAAIWSVPASGWAALGASTVLVAGAIFAARRRAHQVGAISLVGVLAVGVWRDPTLPVDLLSLSSVAGFRDAEAWEAHLLRAVDGVVGSTRLDAGPDGAVVAAPEDWRATEATRGDADSPFDTDLAGRVSYPVGRAADAEVFGGLLAAALAPRHDRILLLNDDMGHALAGVTPIAPSSVDVAAPVPQLVRDVAQLSPSRRDRWLSPSVRLWPDHPSVVLRRAPSPAAIVDIHHGTWFDSAHTAPTQAHLDRVHTALGTYGVYVMVLHLDMLAPGVPARIAGSVAETFASVQLWLPPTGADSLLVVASDRPFELARLEERFDTLKPSFRQLGFPNVASLASMAVGDPSTVEKWSRSDVPTPSPLMLSPSVRGRRNLHLSTMASHLAPAEQTWKLEGAKTQAPALAGRLDSRRSFLELLGDAARGDVASALDKARGLAEDDDGDRALGALVGPHLAQARDALARATREGASSTAWADVHRYASTARMIAPTSAEPLILLGAMSLAQGDLEQANAHFSDAARLADGDLDALTGLARVARLRRDPISAERYFREAATANPRSWVAWHRLGVFLMEMQRYPDAEPILERAGGLAEGSSNAPNLALGRLYLETDRPTPALIHAERALVLDANAEAFLLRGLAYLALDQLDSAEKDFRKAVLANPSLASAHGEIGRIRASRGDLAAAEEAWKAVLRIEPDNAHARENLRRLGAEERRAAAPTAPSSP